MTKHCLVKNCKETYLLRHAVCTEKGIVYFFYCEKHEKLANKWIHFVVFEKDHTHKQLFSFTQNQFTEDDLENKKL